jgi:hypothetical protein
MGIAKDEKEGREGFTEWREGGGVARGSKKKSRRWGNQDNTSIGTSSQRGGCCEVFFNMLTYMVTICIKSCLKCCGDCIFCYWSFQMN